MRRLKSAGPISRPLRSDSRPCAPGPPATPKRKEMRWPLPRQGIGVRGRARKKLNALIAGKLATAPAWELKKALDQSWKCGWVLWGSGLLYGGNG